PILLLAVLLCGSAPLHARHPNQRGPAAASPALSNLSYLGGSGDDQATAIATDSTGNVYVAGFTTSSNFPTAAAAQGAPAGFSDAFVTKLNPSGKLVYSTYLGGSGQDNATSIAVDAAGNAYVAGFTSSANFPTKNPVQRNLKGQGNAFVAKFDPSGAL